MVIYLYMLIIILLCFFLFFLHFLVSFMNNFNRQKNSSFECGFNKISSSRLPFSIQFFLICLLFLLFDIEVSLIIPMIISLKLINFFLMLFMLFFFFILIIGVFIEWFDMSFNWII